MTGFRSFNDDFGGFEISQFTIEYNTQLLPECGS